MEQLVASYRAFVDRTFEALRRRQAEAARLLGEAARPYERLYSIRIPLRDNMTEMGTPEEWLGERIEQELTD